MSFLCDAIAIDSEGELRACPIDALGVTYLGNVFEKGILTVWNGEEIERLRQRHRENKLLPEEFCYGCEWGYSIYDFREIEETEDYILKTADYAVYYNRKV